MHVGADARLVSAVVSRDGQTSHEIDECCCYGAMQYVLGIEMSWLQDESHEDPVRRCQGYIQCGEEMAVYWRVFKQIGHMRFYMLKDIDVVRIGNHDYQLETPYLP